MTKADERIVTLRRVNNSRLPADVYGDSVTKVGSEWDGNTRNPIRGLSPKEEKLLLPSILGVGFDSPNWDNAVLNYWADFAIRVPDEGVPMNIATTTVKLKGADGKEETWEKPVNVKDYIQYRFCLRSSKVAATQEERENQAIYPFYIEDKADMLRNQTERLEDMKRANVEFLKLFKRSKDNKLDESKINWVLEVYKKYDRELGNYNAFSPEEKELYIDQRKNDNPVLFTSIVQDENLEMKAFISEAISMGYLTQAGNAYFNGDEKIGDGIEEAILYFKDPKHNNVLLTLKERMKSHDATKIMA